MSPLAAAMPPATAARMLWSVDFSWPFWILLLVAALYLYGVIRLRRRGVRWPLGRTLSFLVPGLGVTGYALVGGIGVYDDTLLSDHMIQHMLLSMFAPIFLGLGAPVTLALRTLPRRPRHWLTWFLHTPVLRVLTFPVVTFVIFVANPFVLYFTGLYRLTLEYPLLHDWVHLHFLITGSLFFWPLVGLDPLPGRWPYPARALLMLLSTPFHAILGLTVMQSRRLIAGNYYPSLHLTWANPWTDQHLAGGILWAAGEFVSVTMLAALVAQWMRASDREAARIDRQLDRRDAALARRLALARLPGGAGGGAAGAGVPVGSGGLNGSALSGSALSGSGGPNGSGPSGGSGGLNGSGLNGSGRNGSGGASGAGADRRAGMGSPPGGSGGDPDEPPLWEPPWWEVPPAR